MTAEVILGLFRKDRSLLPRPARTPPSTFLFLLFNLSNSTEPKLQIAAIRPNPTNTPRRAVPERPKPLYNLSTSHPWKGGADSSSSGS